MIFCNKSVFFRNAYKPPAKRSSMDSASSSNKKKKVIKPHLSPEIRGRIIQLSRLGYSQRKTMEILKSDKITVGRMTISDLLKKERQTGTIARKKGSGRKRSTTEREDRLIKRIALENRKQSLGDIAKNFESQTTRKTSRWTVSRRLGEEGIKVHRCLKKPLLSVKNRRKRHEFCKKFWDAKKKAMKIGIDYFRNVIYSDESRFCMVSDRPQKCLRRSGEEMRPDCLQTTAKFGGGGIMVWGCISGRGVGPIVWVKGAMDAGVYQTLLESFLIPHLEDSFPDDDFVFQQDGATCHMAKSTMNWLQQKKIPIVKDWPPQSPDLSIIENLWDMIGRKIEKNKYKNVKELWEGVKSAWYSITPAEIESLILSIPHRFCAVSKNRGGSISY